jgi:hypothetical protein
MPRNVNTAWGLVLKPLSVNKVTNAELPTNHNVEDYPFSVAIQPLRTAYITASVRELTPSLEKMFDR